MAKRGKSARTKGHAFEREIAELFRELGWDNCVTSRSESKNTDDKGIDLCFTLPWSVQCKAQEKLTTGLHELISGMPKDDNHNVIIWKRNNKGILVSMDLESFKKIARRVHSF